MYNSIRSREQWTISSAGMSTCLTCRGSQVRVLYRPPKGRRAYYNSASSFLIFCLPSALFQYFKKILGATWTPFLLGIHMRYKSVVPCANPIVFHAASPKYNCLPSRCLHKKQRLSLSCPVFTAVPQFSPPLSGRPKKTIRQVFSIFLLQYARLVLL